MPCKAARSALPNQISTVPAQCNLKFFANHPAVAAQKMASSAEVTPVEEKKFRVALILQKSHHSQPEHQLSSVCYPCLLDDQ